MICWFTLYEVNFPYCGVLDSSVFILYQTILVFAIEAKMYAYHLVLFENAVMFVNSLVCP